MARYTFQLFRPNVPQEHLDNGRALPADQAQLEGAIFSDDVTIIRWMTGEKSLAIFPTFDSFLDIHGHAEYGTQIVFDQAEDEVSV